MGPLCVQSAGALPGAVTEFSSIRPQRNEVSGLQTGVLRNLSFRPAMYGGVEVFHPVVPIRQAGDAVRRERRDDRYADLDQEPGSCRFQQFREQQRFLAAD